MVQMQNVLLMTMQVLVSAGQVMKEVLMTFMLVVDQNLYLVQLTLTALQIPTVMETYVDVCISIVIKLHAINYIYSFSVLHLNSLTLCVKF